MPLRRRGAVHYFEEGEPAPEDRGTASAPPLKVVTLLFAPNPDLFPTISSCAGYDATWVDKLARGVRRNLHRDTEVICLVDRDYEFAEDVRAVKMLRPDLGYFCFIEAFRQDLGIERGLFMQLDTIITGSLADLASLETDLAMPRDPYHTPKLTDSVILFDRSRADELWQAYWTGNPDQLAKVYRIAKWARPEGYPSEFYWIREKVGGRLTFLDEALPGQVVSYKRSCLNVDDQNPDGKIEPTRPELDSWLKRHPTQIPENARIVYCHGVPHPNQIAASPGSEALLRHWR